MIGRVAVLIDLSVLWPTHVSTTRYGLPVLTQIVSDEFRSL